MRYDPNMTIRQALEKFYQSNGFDPKDSKKNYYRINFGPLVAYVYNPDERKEVVHLHDVEHILYEVDATIIGEAEISAISLASRGKKPCINYLYGSIGIITGMFIDQKRTLRGFVRGMKRRSVFDFARNIDILDMRVGELRQELGIFV